NIKGIRVSQDLFDDLSDDPNDWSLAIAAEASTRLPTESPLITRPFDYGTVISYSFEVAHWQATRFSNGTRYGVWYGALDVETTVYETVYHWRRFVLDSYAKVDREIVGERRVFNVRCDALLLDFRGRERAYPKLIDRNDYTFAQRVGAYVAEQGLNGLVVRSARCDGVIAAVFKPERLSNPRDRCFLTYRTNPCVDRCVVERTPGRRWMDIVPSSLS
ncbi:MAG TPA: RES family NAD+ phosphorylase, partial [Burkholderiaceae bacterium]|nr:RES family NAD+ phosphorylase [Burkholderiaceae bacterium]